MTCHHVCSRYIDANGHSFTNNNGSNAVQVRQGLSLDLFGNMVDLEIVYIDEKQDIALLCVKDQKYANNTFFTNGFTSKEYNDPKLFKQKIESAQYCTLSGFGEFDINMDRNEINKGDIDVNAVAKAYCARPYIPSCLGLSSAFQQDIARQFNNMSSEDQYAYKYLVEGNPSKLIEYDEQNNRIYHRLLTLSGHSGSALSIESMKACGVEIGGDPKISRNLASPITKELHKAMIDYAQKNFLI